MTQRLDEIAEQAIIDSLFEPMEPNFTIGMSDGKMVIPVSFVENFAKLMVKECADFLMDVMDNHFAAEQLLDHFENLK
jgi:hypothetical protein